MNTHIGRLTALLFVQLVLVALLWALPGDAGDEAVAFLSVESDLVDRLQIADGESEVELTKLDGVWQVNGLPGDSQKIDDLTREFAALSAPWPVASSAGSAERFEVAQDRFQRRVRLHAGDTLLAEFYLGTSPGYQRVHARLSDSDDIFSIELTNYDVAANEDDWLDKSIFALDQSPDGIIITFKNDASVTLTRTPEGWLYQDEVADQDAARAYASRFANLQILGLAKEKTQSSVVAKIELATEQGPQNFTVYALETDDGYLIAVSDEGPKYRLATYTAEQLLMTDADFSVKELNTVSDDN